MSRTKVVKNPKPRFKGEVYIEFNNGDIQGPYTIKKAHLQPLTRIFMYSFNETEICVGECYLKKNKTDKKLKMSECIYDNEQTLSTLEGLRPSMGDIAAEGVRNYAGLPEMLFFRPDQTLINWLINYANGRIIIEVGCGSCRVLENLADAGGKVMGIEPFLDTDSHMKMTQNRISRGKGMIQVLPRRVEDCGTLLNTLCKDNKALVMFARPCHSDFVENGIDLLPKGTETLYITLPENMDLYDDLGKYKPYANELKYEGRSADKEVIYSIIK